MTTYRLEARRHNKNYMSIGVSVRTTKFAACSGIGVRQESNPQSPTAYSSKRYRQPYDDIANL